MMKQKQIKCPYCHANASLRPASVVYGLNRRSQGKFLYLCDRWPACDAYVSAHDRTHRPTAGQTKCASDELFHLVQSPEYSKDR